MASDALFLALAQAKARKDPWARAADAAGTAGEGVIGGYAQGVQLADAIRKKKLAEQTLSAALGGQVPEPLKGYENIPIETLKELGGLGAVAKTTAPSVNFLLPNQAEAAGVSPEVIQSYGGKPIPRQIGQMDIGRRQGDERNKNLASLAGTRQAGVQNSVLNTALRYSQAGMVQTAAKDSFSRLGNINRAQQLLAQIQSQGGGATVRQRTELASAVGRSINPTGVLTNEALNLYIPQTLRGKVGNFTEYLSNESAPVDFTGFVGELGGLLQREKEVNQSLIQGASDFGNPAIEQLKSINPSLAGKVQAANQSPLVTNPGQASNFPSNAPHFSSGQEAEASGYKGPAIINGRRAMVH